MPSVDTDALMARARCFKCIPAGMLWEVILGESINPNANPCGIPSDTIILSGAGDPSASQLYNKVGNAWFGADDFAYSIEMLNGKWSVMADGESIYVAVNFPCTWTVVGATLPVPPAPSGHYG